jgi:hypothetical protein
MSRNRRDPRKARLRRDRIRRQKYAERAGAPAPSLASAKYLVETVDNSVAAQSLQVCFVKRSLAAVYELVQYASSQLRSPADGSQSPG